MRTDDYCHIRILILVLFLVFLALKTSNKCALYNLTMIYTYLNLKSYINVSDCKSMLC